MEERVFVGFGGNLPSPEWGPPRRVIEAALAALDGEAGVRVMRRSPFYRTRPQPPSAQPWFVNGVAEIATVLPPATLLARLHGLEARFGRVRRAPNEARILDLDLLAYGTLATGPDEDVIVPHPRLHERVFVLRPLCDLAPTWRHPRLQCSAAELLAALAVEQTVLPIGDAE
jgi:2-amino-4-hydroxy-6-hydroxymethyldihydropteridine diphosphokinase